MTKLVSLAAVSSIVTQRSSPQRCVTILKTAARETMTKLASEWVDNRPFFAPREIENNANAKFKRNNKEYYGIFEKRPKAMWITTS